MTRIRGRSPTRVCVICGMSYPDAQCHLGGHSAKWREIPASCSTKCSEERRHREAKEMR